MRNKLIKKNHVAHSSGTIITVPELIALRSRMMSYSKDKVHQWLKGSGQKRTRIRGRGIEFDSIREYQAGDDIRNMAWRVTARSLKPFVKVYQEERERPVYFALDLSPSLYFGTRHMFKSVRIIKEAGSLGWHYLREHDRIGAMIATEAKIHHFQPERSERHFLAILNSFAQCSEIRPSFNENHYLHQLLLTLQQQSRSGNLIFILSDFHSFDDNIQKCIKHMAQRSQVVLMFIYDPFEAVAPPPHHYFLTDGQRKISFNMNIQENRMRYQEQFLKKKKKLIDFSRQYHIGLQMLCTNDEEGMK